MLNHITIMGRLTRDPELRRTGSGVAVASFTVAVERDFAQNGQKETDFLDCVAWRQPGEFVSKYFRKGSMIVVSGRLQIRSWNDKDGNKRRTAEIVVDNCYFGESKKASEGASGSYGGNSYGTYQESQTSRGTGGTYSQPSYPGYGGYSGQEYQQQDFAVIEDDDAKLPF